MTDSLVFAFLISATNRRSVKCRVRRLSSDYDLQNIMVHLPFCLALLVAAICTTHGLQTGVRFHRRWTRLSATKEATFGCGCFWAPAEKLKQVKGVVDTVAGYTGNPSAAQVPPTYENVCFSRGWVEAVRVQYDDEEISYRDLLDAFFDAQDPRAGSRQYASIIFPNANDSEQRQAAQQWLQDNQGRVRGDGIPASLTQIEQQSPFFKAEEYHQEYWQKMRPRMAGMVALLAVSTGILDSLTPLEMQSAVHTVANSVVLCGLAFVLVERKIDTKTIEL